MIVRRLKDALTWRTVALGWISAFGLALVHIGGGRLLAGSELDAVRLVTSRQFLGALALEWIALVPFAILGHCVLAAWQSRDEAPDASSNTMVAPSDASDDENDDPIGLVTQPDGSISVVPSTEFGLPERPNYVLHTGESFEEVSYATWRTLLNQTVQASHIRTLQRPGRSRGIPREAL